MYGLYALGTIAKNKAIDNDKSTGEHVGDMQNLNKKQLLWY